MCGKEIKTYIQDTVEANTNRIKYDILRQVEPVRRDVTDTLKKVSEINGTVKNHTEEIASLYVYQKTRELDCPFAEIIKEHSDNLLTETTLKEFIREQNKEKREEDKQKDLRMRWIVGLIGIAFTVVQIIIGIVLYGLQNL